MRFKAAALTLSLNNMSRRDFHPGSVKNTLLCSRKVTAETLATRWEAGGGDASSKPLSAAGGGGASFAHLFFGRLGFDGCFDCRFQHGADDAACEGRVTFGPAADAAGFAKACLGEDFGQSAFDDAV